MPYDKVRTIRQSNINPGKFVYYRKPVLIHQVSYMCAYVEYILTR